MKRQNILTVYFIFSGRGSADVPFSCNDMEDNFEKIFLIEGPHVSFPLSAYVDS